MAEKFSQFTDNSTPSLTDIVVGLSGDVNVRYTLTAIKSLVLDGLSAEDVGAGTFTGNFSFSGAITVSSDSTINGHKIGRGAGNFLTNTAIGSGAMTSNPASEQYNVAIGFEALYTATRYNTAVGYYALRNLTTGYANTAIGPQSLFANQTGNYNFAAGVEVLARNTSGNDNTGVGGYDTLLSNTTGSSNNALGYAAMYSNTTGSSNTALGKNALYNNQVGGDNVAVGVNAGRSTLASSNVFIGMLSGYAHTTGTKNTYLGTFSQIDATTGSNNTFVGAYSAGMTTGSNNTIIGANVNIGNVSGNIALAQGDGTVKMRYDATEWTITGKTNITGNLNMQGVSAALGQLKPWNNFIDIGSTVNNGVVGIQLGINEGGGTNQRYAALFLDDSTGEYGFISTASNGLPTFVIQGTGGGNQLSVNGTTGNVSITGVSSSLGNIKSWSKFLDIGSTTNNGIVGIQLGIYEGPGTNQRSVGLFLDDSSGKYGFISTANSGLPTFVIQGAAGTDYLSVNGATGVMSSFDHHPLTDNTYYLGKNSASSPLAWKGVILKDTVNANRYRVEVVSGVVTATIVV